MNGSLETQTPMEQVAERIADTMPGVMFFPRMLAVRDYAKSQKDYHRRVEDSHQQQAAALRGEEPPNPSDGEEDDAMGDTFVACGDVYGNEGVRMLQERIAKEAAAETLPAAEALPASEPATEKPKTLLEKAAPYLLAAALGGVPGGSALTYLFTRPDPTPPPAVSRPAPAGYEYTGQGYTPGQE